MMADEGLQLLQDKPQRDNNLKIEENLPTVQLHLCFVPASITVCGT